MKPPDQVWLQALLSPLAGLYGLAVRRRNRRYDRPENVHRAGVPVISVGNLTAGGTGKTPLVAWLARALHDAGRRPAIVSRGYGGRAGRGPVWVSRGAGPICDARLSGDEPYLLARAIPEVPIVVGADRVAAARAAAEQEAGVLVLDDGFQHRRLARDLDLVLLDAEHPFGNGHLIPAGLLREPLDSLRRAGVVLITRTSRDARHPETEARIRRHNPAAPILHAGHRPCGWFDAAGNPVPAPRSAVAFCGIGNPDSFRRDLLAAGLSLVHFESFGDHHRYLDRELQRLRRLATENDATLVTTEKDVARLGAEAGSESAPPLHAMRIEAVPYEAERLLQAVNEVLADPELG